MYIYGKADQGLYLNNFECAQKTYSVLGKNPNKQELNADEHSKKIQSSDYEKVDIKEDIDEKISNLNPSNKIFKSKNKDDLFKVKVQLGKMLLHKYKDQNSIQNKKMFLFELKCPNARNNHGKDLEPCLDKNDIIKFYYEIPDDRKVG